MAVALLGVPWDGSSSFQRGAAEAPARIREALHSPSSNCLQRAWRRCAGRRAADDAGDLSLPDDAGEARAAIEAGCPRARPTGAEAAAPRRRSFGHLPDSARVWQRAAALTVLHLDAHADLYDEFDGDRYSHACPFARVMEEKLAARLVQVGVRTLTAHQRSQAAKFGVEMLGADRWRDALPLITRFRAPVYVSLDLDVLEPMLAPGVSHPEPGGLAVRDVLEILARAQRVAGRRRHRRVQPAQRRPRSHRARRREVRQGTGGCNEGLISASDDGIVVGRSGPRQYKGEDVMQRLRVVPTLRQCLGDDGTEALTEMVYTAVAESREDVLNAVTLRFENRLTHEISALHVGVTRELASMRVEIIRWSFLFWITQLGAMVGLLAYMK